MRTAKIERKTKETEISLKMNIDGKGKYSVDTEIGFFSHMLESFSKFSLFDTEIKVRGDLKVDQHHTIEDTGIVLGQALGKALGDKKGINRTGYFIGRRLTICSITRSASYGFLGFFCIASSSSSALLFSTMSLMPLSFNTFLPSSFN